MSLHLLQATLEDASALTEVYMNSFQDNLSRARYSRSSQPVRQWWTDSVQRTMRTKQDARLLKIVTPEAKIIAYAKWLVPAAEKTANAAGHAEEEEQKPPQYPEGVDVELSRFIATNFAAKRKEVMGTRPHYYLDYLCCLPEHQGKGAAGMLLRWGLDQADEKGLEAYLEATPMAVKYYEKFGFKVVGELPIERVNHTETYMLRPAKKG